MSSSDLEEPLGVAAEEHTCRICQLEGTTEHALFHPCKCRGSIKYIHQDCLEEWLKRSGRDGRCDICHEEYTFTTVYDENTPEVAPLKLITLKAKSQLLRGLRYAFAYVSLVFGVLEILFFWTVAKRFIDWIIDSNATRETFWTSLLYGDMEFTGDPFSAENVKVAITNSSMHSIISAIYFIIVHLLLFLEHEWVSKDPGFQKLIKKKIGSDVGENPRIRRRNLVNPNFEIENQRVNNLENLEQIRRILEEAEPNNDRARQVIRAVVQDMERDNGIVEGGEDANFDQPRFRNQVPDIPNIPNQRLGPFFNDLDDDQDVEDRVQDNDRGIVDPIQFPAENGIGINMNQERQQIDRQRLIAERQRAERLAREIVERQREANIAIPEIDQEEVINLPGEFILSIPVLITIVAANCFIGTYLLIAYMIPITLGHFVLEILSFLVIIVSSLILKVFSVIGLKPFFNQAYNYSISTKKSFPLIDAFLDLYVLNPVSDVFSHVVEQKSPVNKLEKYLPMVLFYGVILASILVYLRVQERKHGRQNPLRGFQRKIFIILFDLVSTLKVFLIFFTELFVFPTFCGLLLEFSLTPIFATDFKLLLNSLPILGIFPWMRLIISWTVGTAYMCLFALFVGMTRRFILRPGLLFFIRSPEDPNARLVHDALVRPLGLQLSRIALSGLVYTLFILIGLGAVTHGLRATGTPLLPIDLGLIYQSIYSLPIFVAVVSIAQSKQDILKKYVRQYWGRAFKVAASKTKLSSFVLGNHDPKVRGYVVYRNWRARLQGAKPEYLNPISLEEAKETFKTTDIQACFIPDGNLVRAPNSDIVSRKFVKKLFIPVTRDDIPLQTEAEMQKASKEIDEFDDSEDELVTTNSYEIVYRPPLFGARVILFISILWFFAVSLICGTLVLANIIGKPAILLLEDFNKLLALEPLGFWQNVEKIGILDTILKLDIISIPVGLTALVFALEMYDNHLIRRRLQEEGEAEDEVLNIGTFGVNEYIINGARVVLLYCVYHGSHIYDMYWCWVVHREGVNSTYAYFKGLSRETWHSNAGLLLVHSLVFQFTVVQSVLNMYKLIVFRRNGNLRESALNALTASSKKFFSTHLFVILGNAAVSIYEYYNHPKSYTSLTAAIRYTLIDRKVHSLYLTLLWPLAIGTAGLILIFTKFFKFFMKINAEVKEEFYSKGKTLENKEISEKPTESDELPNVIDTAHIET